MASSSSRPSTPKSSTKFQPTPMRSQTGPVKPHPSSSAPRLRTYPSANFVRPPGQAGIPTSTKRQARHRPGEEDRIRRDCAAIKTRINHGHDVILQALDSVVKTAHKESERIRYDLQRLESILESGTATIIKDIAVLETALRREEERAMRDLQRFRQIQDPRKRDPELDRLDAALDEGERQTTYEYLRLQTARNAEVERIESAATALTQARRKEESRLARDLQRLHNARADSRKREDEELASLALRVLTECDLPPLHAQIQSLRERQRELGVQLDAALATFATQSFKTTTEINLEAHRVTELRREKKRALDDNMSRLTKVRSDCRLRVDAKIQKFMMALENDRSSRASKPQPKAHPPQSQMRAAPPQSQERPNAPPGASTQQSSATESTQQLSQAQQAREAWQKYEAFWSSLAASNTPVRLSFHKILWPVLSPPSSISDLNSKTISAFILSSLHDGGGSTPRERVRNAMRLWHPDKWVGRYMTMVGPRHAEAVKGGVDAVTRVLTELLTTSNSS